MSKNSLLGQLQTAAKHLPNTALKEVVAIANWFGDGKDGPAKVAYMRRTRE